MAAGLDEEVVERHVQRASGVHSCQMSGAYLVNDEEQSRTSGQFLSGLAGERLWDVDGDPHGSRTIVNRCGLRHQRGAFSNLAERSVAFQYSTGPKTPSYMILVSTSRLTHSTETLLALTGLPNNARFGMICAFASVSCPLKRLSEMPYAVSIGVR